MNIVVEEGGYMPERGHKDDAGLDLRTPEGIFIPSCTSKIIDTRIRVQIPKGYYGKIESKSGLAMKHNVLAPFGVIDSGYTGTIRVKVFNFGNKSYKFERGDKIAQLVIVPCITPELNVVDSLEDTERGEDGFGSTGR